MATTSVSVHPRSIPWRVATFVLAALVVALTVVALTIGFGGHSAATPVGGSASSYSSVHESCYPTHPGKVC